MSDKLSVKFISIIWSVIIISLVFIACQDKGSKSKNNDGFDFDIWQSGMDIEQILLIAETHHIPLLRSGLISGNKKFNPKASRKYAKTATHYYYKTQLLGRHANVDLRLTPTSKRLHTLSIKWHGMVTKDRSEFEDEIKQVINDKYGDHKRKARNIMSIAIPESDWKYLRTRKENMLSTLCGRINEQSKNTLNNQSASEHEKYLKMYKYIKKSDKVVADCFNDWRRSNIWLKIQQLRYNDLLTDEHLDQMSDDVRTLMEHYQS